ncbi:MAG: hypothetical protein ACK5JT_17665 [Hyphomicrobiaceae bacterium]
MGILTWIFWLITSFLGLLWSIVWFLLGGWVSTLAQIAVIILAVFTMKYGWRRAPQEFVARTGAFLRFAWAWLRSGEVRPAPTTTPSVKRNEKRRRRAQKRRQVGDVRINISTAMSLAVIVGLGLLAAL